MLTLTIDGKKIHEDVLILSNSIIKNYRAAYTFDQHAQYANFKLNDPKYLDALALLSNLPEFEKILVQFNSHYYDTKSKVLLDNNSDLNIIKSFIAFTEKGNVSKIFKEFPAGFYAGFKTKLLDPLCTSNILSLIPAHMRYGLAMNKFIKSKELVEDSRVYINLMTYHPKFLKTILTHNNQYTEFNIAIAEILYKKETACIISPYLEDIASTINYSLLTLSQKAQYIKNIYTGVINSEIKTLSLKEQLQYMDTYCEHIVEWPIFKNKIGTLHNVMDLIPNNKNLVLSLLTEMTNTIELPEIQFNT